MCFSSIFINIFSANKMPAFRQVGEKQLPNPVLCMAWSPKRDLIALANTTGEVILKQLFWNTAQYSVCVCVCVLFNTWLMFFHSCCFTAWLVSSVYGPYHPVSILARRSQRLPGDQMAKVRSDCAHLLLFLVMCLMESWCNISSLQFWHSVLETLSR